MINHEYKVLFIHVIKTGGISIATALNMEQKQNHSRASKIKKEVGESVWNCYYKFSFVRNPFDKIVSQYHYNRSGFGLQNSTFKEYVKAWYNGKKISNSSQFNLFYLDEKLDFIGRFENIQKDFDIICDKIGIPKQELPHKNKSQHKHYTEYYDDETREIVAEKYAKDIEYFGYKFGE
tara:strand:- start:1022 stop:1555 length:534 start_codon:yes stop_codon:yes gene_type:complete